MPKSKTDTTAKMRLYWAEWKLAAAELERSLGLDRAGLEAERQDIHQRAIGGSYSSRDIVADNRLLDQLLASFRAISRPADMHAQLDAQAQPKRRIIWVIRRDLKALDAGPEYLAAILQRMSSEGAIPLHTDLHDYDFCALQRIATAVRRTLSARRKAKD